MSADERPRERLLAHGPQVLSDAELLAVLLRSGNGAVTVDATIQALLTRFPGLSGMAEMKAAELLAVPGIGPSKATSLSAGVELGQRVSRRAYERFGTVASSHSLGQRMLRRFAGVGQEHMLVLLLDVKNAVIQEVEAARGGVDAAMVDPRVVFRAALAVNASRMILVHNHPSGDPRPSAADQALTERFIAAGELLGVTVLDHLIIGASEYFSFAQKSEDLRFSK